MQVTDWDIKIMSLRVGMTPSSYYRLQKSDMVHSEHVKQLIG